MAEWNVAYLGVATVALGIAALALAGVATWLARRLGRLEGRYRALMSGAGAESLEAALVEYADQVRAATAKVQELDELTRHLERTSRSHLQRVGFLRFNPFRETGGDQSFAAALADADGNGLVLSSLHSRDVTRVYAKPLAAWQTSYQLTEEERRVIDRARGEA